MRLTLPYVYEYVRDSLGLGEIEVELTDAHIQKAVKSAVSQINCYAPVKRWGLLNLNTQTDANSVTTTNYGGVVLYSDVELTDPDAPSAEYTARKNTVRVIPGLQNICEVVGVRRRDNTGDIDLFDPLVFVAGGVQNAGGLASYQLVISYIEQARRMFSKEVEWKFVWDYDAVLNTRIGQLYVSLPTASFMTYGVNMYVSLTADDNVKSGISYVPDGLTKWFLDYVLARSKLTLARILGKFGGIPMADGGNNPLDSNELRQEGNEEIRRLDESIARWRVTLPPLVG